MSDLAASFAWCRSICRSSGSSFVPSFRLLAPERREAMFALYAFARISDDLSDPLPNPFLTKSQDADEFNLRREALEAWRQQIQQLGRQPAAQSSLKQYELLWPALADAVERFSIPPQLLIDIVDGVTMDLSHEPFSHWDELRIYCYHVASAVGLACTHIWKAPTAQIDQEAAIDCGIAFQLTNILRDVAEDAERGRIYLPNEWLAGFNVSSEAWLAGRPDGRWLELVDYVADLAIDLYHHGWRTIEHLTPDSQRMFSLMWRSYRALLDVLISRKNELWLARLTLAKTTKFKLAAQHFIPGLYATLPFPARQSSTRQP